MNIEIDIEDLDPTCPSTFVLGCAPHADQGEPYYVALIHGEDLPGFGTVRIEFKGMIGTADALEACAREIRRIEAGQVHDARPRWVDGIESARF